MSLRGRLEDLPLPHLIQILAQKQATGKLTVTSPQGHGVVVFRGGRVIYAATNAARETIGNLLLMQRAITASTLMEALEKQGSAHSERRLGSILVEMGAIDRDTIERVMREQVGDVLEELFRWRSGFLKFEAMEIPERGEVEVDAEDFLMKEGLAADVLVLDALEEMEQDDEEEAILALLGSGTGGGAIPALDVSLKEIMAEIRSPAFTGEITLQVLRFASRFFDRGALFLHSGGFLTGIGQFGFETGGHDRTRTIRIPANEPSVFLEAITRREIYKGPLEKKYWNIQMHRHLGSAIPPEAVVAPMLVSDRAVLLLYGDNLESGRPIPALDELELLMIQAGLAIEKSLLETRLRSVEHRSQKRG